MEISNTYKYVCTYNVIPSEKQTENIIAFKINPFCYIKIAVYCNALLELLMIILKIPKLLSNRCEAIL